MGIVSMITYRLDGNVAALNGKGECNMLIVNCNIFNFCIELNSFWDIRIGQYQRVKDNFNTKCRDVVQKSTFDYHELWYCKLVHYNDKCWPFFSHSPILLIFCYLKLNSHFIPIYTMSEGTCQRNWFALSDEWAINGTRTWSSFLAHEPIQYQKCRSWRRDNFFSIDFNQTNNLRTMHIPCRWIFPKTLNWSTVGFTQYHSRSYLN